MREITSRFDRAIESIDSFLKMENASSIVLSLYKSDSTRLSRRYQNLTFSPLEAIDEPRKLYKYTIEKKWFFHSNGLILVQIVQGFF